MSSTGAAGPTGALTRREQLRAIAAAGLSGVGVMALAACGGASTAGEAPKSALSAAPVTIKYYKRSQLDEAKTAALLVDWKNQHPTWTVEVVQAVNDDAKLGTYVAAGEKMDTLTYFEAARTLVLAFNWLRPLDSYVARDKYNVAKFSAKEVDLIGRYDGKLWALPYAYGGNGTATFYNRSMFKEAGVAEPPADWNQAWTWDQFRENARKLTKKSGSSVTQAATNAVSDGALNTVTTLGVLSDAKIISDDYKKALVDSPPTLEAFEKYTDVVVKDGVLAHSPGVDLGADPFLNGKLAMQTISGGPLAFTRRLKATGIDWGFMPLPKMKYSSPDFQSVLTLLPKSGDNPDHGWELFKYVIEDARLGNQEERVPAVLEDAQDWAKANFAEFPNSRVQVVVDGIKVARPVDKIKYHPATKELYDATKLILVDSVFAGKETVKAGFSVLQQQLQSILDRAPSGK
jgi:ABC-type glycerol-3-phosphate transport system substrate-binding protein